jgi:hypothetical protein
MDHRSIAEIDEGELIGLLLLDQYRRLDILRLYGIPDDVHAFQQVDLKNVPGDFKGDIDLLLCAPSRPDAATAIQVKRVKVGAKALLSGKVNKLKKCREGVWQANDLARIGFAQVYLFVFVVILIIL